MDGQRAHRFVLYDHGQSADAPLMSAEWDNREHRYAAIGRADVTHGSWLAHPARSHPKRGECQLSALFGRL